MIGFVALVILAAGAVFTVVGVYPRKIPRPKNRAL
jgi:hypothetical protein